MFDKEEYWKNRKAGKRGQGEYAPTMTLATLTPRQPKEPRKRKNRRFTKKGFTQVVKLEGDKRVVMPTKIGSKLHKEALRNSANYRRTQARTSARESG